MRSYLLQNMPQQMAFPMCRKAASTFTVAEIGSFDSVFWKARATETTAARATMLKAMDVNRASVNAHVLAIEAFGAVAAMRTRRSRQSC
jgi:hypothetical protein